MEFSITRRNGDVYKGYIDDKYAYLLEEYKWCVQPKSHTYYFITNIESNGKRTTLKIHRKIMELENQTIGRNPVDHINHNGFDNRVENLRVVSTQENSLNRGNRNKPTSGYTGVYSNGKGYVARVRVAGMYKNLGTYPTAYEAYLTREKWLSENEHTRLPSHSYIYIIQCQDKYKIGFSSNPKYRCQALSSPCVGRDKHYLVDTYSVSIDKVADIEHAIHQKISGYQADLFNSKEYFNMDLPLLRKYVIMVLNSYKETK